MEKRPTQKEVARQAGVSQSSVSLAMKNHASIPAATRKRILAIAEKLGYRPDPVLSSLISYRQAHRPTIYRACLAWIQQGRDPQPGSDHFRYHEGASERAEQLGYQLEKFKLSDQESDQARLNKILLARGINGLLVAPLPVERGRLKLEWKQFSAVTFGYTLESPSLNLVANHHLRSMYILIRHMRAHGYRRIGLAIPAAHDSRVDYNYSAAFQAMQCRFPSADQVPMFLPDQFEEKTFLHWVQTYQPDALITAGYTRAVEWLERLRQGGRRRPGIAQISRRGAENFAGVDENSLLIGRVAVDLLAGMIQRNERGIPSYPQHVLIDGTWAKGTSLPKRKR